MASVSMKNGWARGLLSYAIIALVIVLMCLILYLFLSQGERIIRKIGNSGSIVINRKPSSPSRPVTPFQSDASSNDGASYGAAGVR